MADTDGLPAASVGDLVLAVEHVYPAALAEPWDTGIGLAAGDRSAPARTVLLAVDLTERVLDEAVALGADAVLTHHPLLFAPVQHLAADTSRGRILARAAREGRAGVALLSAHTNADAARPGVSDALAEILGMRDGEPLQPSRGGGSGTLLVTYVPIPDVAPVLDALAAAGAGVVGAYERCAFLGPGTGTFLPGPGARPTIGAVGTVEEVAEVRLEVRVPAGSAEPVRAALLAAHPYDEPAYAFLPVQPLPRTGLGRVGTLAQPMTVAQLARLARDRLPVGPAGVRVAGDPDRPVRRLAVCGGAGGDLVGRAAALGADAYLTADLRHHTALDTLAEGGARAAGRGTPGDGVALAGTGGGPRPRPPRRVRAAPAAVPPLDAAHRPVVRLGPHHRGDIACRLIRRSRSDCSCWQTSTPGR